MEWIVLGSAAGMPQGKRINSGYILRTGRGLYQFDCGGGVAHSFRKENIDPLQIKKIFISHTHPDHCSDLPLMVQMNYLYHRREPLDIYLPDEAVEIFKDYFKALYLIPEKFGCDVNFHAVGSDFSVRDGEIKVTARETRHFRHNAELIAKLGLPNKMQSFGYQIEGEGKRILYSADLGSEEDIFNYLEDMDLLIVESTHINITKLFKRAVEIGVKKILLSHIDVDFDIDEAWRIAEVTGVENLIIAEDGLVVPV